MIETQTAIEACYDRIFDDRFWMRRKLIRAHQVTRTFSSHKVIETINAGNIHYDIDLSILKRNSNTNIK